MDLKLFTFVAYFWLANCISQRSQHAIYHHIFKNYTKNLRPVADPTTVTPVYLDAGLYSIDQLDELHQTVTLTQWRTVSWNDELLRWDPAKYGNITELTIPANIIWVPDIVIIGLIEQLFSVKRKYVFGDLSFDGNMTFSFLTVDRVHCNFDIKLFPFDTQCCTVKYGSWDYNGNEIDLYPMEAEHDARIGITKFQHNSEWNLVLYESHRVSAPEPGADGMHEIHYLLMIRRLPAYYIFALVVPSFVITNLALVGLFSPCEASGHRYEKVTMGLTTLLTMAVLLLIVADHMPKTQEGLPLIGTYILCEIFVTSTAACVTIVIMYLHRRSKQNKPPPKWCLNLLCISDAILKHKISNLKLVPKRKNAEQNPRSELSEFVNKIHQSLIKITKEIENKNARENVECLWFLLCERLDELMMICFVATNVILTTFMIAFVKTNSCTATFDT